MTLSILSLYSYLKQEYDKQTFDYWIPPGIKTDSKGVPKGRVESGDALIFACRRGEREIQLTEAFTDDIFPHFPREAREIDFFPMVPYHEKFHGLTPLFPVYQVENTLGQIISEHKLTQLRVAESEKSAHVSYFFNGRSEPPFPGETRKTIPSLKGDYAKTPQMRSIEIARLVTETLEEEKQEFTLINFAAGDILGHIPNWETNVACVEYVDEALGILHNFALRNNYALVITADHGLLEQAYLPDGSPSVSHTLAPVPFVIAYSQFQGQMSLGHTGKSLADVAPTILRLLDLPKPEMMTGESLLHSKDLPQPAGVILVVLDGWGVGKQDKAINPIYAAHTPNLDRIFRTYPWTELIASGEAVGLLPGSSGNSETGHLTLGAGRVILQDEVRIPQGLADGHLISHPVFRSSLQRVSRQGKSLHILFLLSRQSSHGSVSEGMALVRLAKDLGVHRVFLHCILDGRSSPPQGGRELLDQLQLELEQIGVGEIVTVVGRGFALDRSGDYQKTRLAYEALTQGGGFTWQSLG